jgi:hypothetical protein
MGNALISFWSKARRYGCQSAPRYPHKDPIFGLDLFASELKEQKIGNLNAAQRERFSRLGKTYELNLWGTSRLRSGAPRVQFRPLGPALRVPVG